MLPLRQFVRRDVSPWWLVSLAMLATVALAPAASRNNAAPAGEPPIVPLVVDEAYAPLLEDTGGGLVLAAILHDDNRALIGGTFEFVNNTAQRYLAALAADGSLDANFASGGGPDGPVHALLALPDGGILVGGAFRHFGPQPAAGLVRLTAEGRIDEGFSLHTRVDGEILVLAHQPDGKILVGGSFREFAGAPARGLVRLLPDGTRDDAFQPVLGEDGQHTTVVSLAILPDDGLAVVGRHAATALRPLDPHAWPAQGLAPTTRFLVRLQADGAADPGFQPHRTLDPTVVCALPGGELMLAGSGDLQRLNRDGSVDGRFRFQAQGTMRVQTLLPLDAERVLVGGDVWGNATLSARLLVVDRNGRIQARFVMPRDEEHSFHVVARNRRGRVLVGGRNAPAVERLSFSKTENRVLLLDERLGVDRSFRAHIGAAGEFSAATLSVRNTLSLAGTFKSGEGLTGTSITRLQPDGTPDRMFQPVGELHGLPHVLVALPDGGLLVGGIVNTAINIRKPRPVLRLRGDGTADPDFIPDVPVDGHFTDAVLVRDGTVIMVGSLSGNTPDRNFAGLIRFDLAGRVDRRLAEIVPSWLAGGPGRLLTVAETATGHLLVGGEFARLQNRPRPGIARIGEQGVVDPAFVPETKDFAVVTKIIPLLDQRIFVDGWTLSDGELPIARRFARLLPDGRRDPGYVPPTDFAGQEPLLAHVLADGTTLVVLHDPSPTASVRLRLARLDRGGSRLPEFDVTLGNHGTNLMILPAVDGAVYLVGDVPLINGALRHGIARLVPQR